MHQPTIIEVRRRSSQGVTEPFLCMADDGHMYWVKGNDAGKHSLCAEWVAGSIALELGLPLPPFKQVVVPEELVRDSMFEGIRDLGPGIAFGSQHIPNCRELQFNDIRKLERSLRARILFFDWLVQNGDRRLDQNGGNVNLLWSVEEKRMWVIDHNVAFEDDFSCSSLFTRHVFAQEKEWLVSSQFLDLLQRMNEIIEKIDGILNELPGDWLFFDRDCSESTDFPQAVREMLKSKPCAVDVDWRV